MSKKLLLIAGVVFAAGSVAAISSPHIRDGQLRLGQLFAQSGDDDADAGLRRSGRRHRNLEAEGDGSAVRRAGRRFGAGSRDGDGEQDGLRRPRRERSAVADADEEGGSLDSRGGFGRWFGKRAYDRHAGEELDTGTGADRPRGDADSSRRASIGRQSGRVDRQFSRLDRNGDGVVDAKDFEVRAAELAANATRRFLKRFDTNGDGKVSREEFERVVNDGPEERVADLELDGDGKLTDAEPPLRQPRRGIVK